MADKHIYIDDSPKNPDLKTSPFDWTYTTNLTGRFGKVNCAMMKYLPPHTKLKVKPYFAFDMHPLVFPVQTNVRCHLKFYKVPLRILWKDFEDFASQIGTNGLPTNGGGTQFVVPYIKRPTGWNAVGSLAEQIGCCNQTLTGVPSNRPVIAGFFKGDISNNYFNPTTFNSAFGSSCFFLQFPKGVLYQPNNVDSYDNVALTLSFTSRDSASVTGSKSLKIDAFIRHRSNYTVHNVGGHNEDRDVVNEEFVRIATHTSDNSVSYSAFNSTAVSCNSQPYSTSIVLNGITVYNHTVIVKIVDDDFWNSINSYLSQDVDVYLRIEPVGNYANQFFPNTMVVPSQDNLINYFTKVDKDDQENLQFSETLVNVRDSIGATSTVLLPLVTVRSSIDTKFDSIDGADPAVPIPALPFRALEFIHNYFMRNPRIDPFVKDGVPTYNRFLTNDGSGADSTTPVESWNALYESDYFTTCVKEPQFGNAPLVGATVNDTSTTGILTFGDGTTFNNYVVKLNADEEGNVAPLSVYPESADKPTMDRLNELINFGISINDLRNVSTFQRMLERMQRTSYRFANVVYEFFGTNPPVGDHYPQYLGGVSRNVTVDKITNIAESEGHPLGTFAGQGKFRGEGESISVFTTEPCYLVCIQYFTVTPTYSQYLPKHLLYKNPLDFYMNPEFAFMGPQPVYKGEIAPNQVTADHFYDVFGYNRPYAELFGNVDEVHGLYKTDMANFLLQRFFGDAPELNKSFIEINSSDLTNIFAVVKNTDKMFGQILFKGTSQLPAPRSYLPRSI